MTRDKFKKGKQNKTSENGIIALAASRNQPTQPSANVPDSQSCIPPRTKLSQEECQRVVDIGNTIKTFDISNRYKHKNPTTSVIVHENGIVSVGISGSAQGDSRSMDYAEKLQNVLNESAGYHKYIVSASTDIGLLSKIPESVDDGNLPGVYAEHKVAAAAHHNPSKIIGMDVRYYIPHDNRHCYNGMNQMAPCKTCDFYMEEYIRYANSK